MGKLILKTSMLNIFRLCLFLLVIFFFHDLYLETYQDPKFIEEGRFSLMHVLFFLYRYPYELILFLLLVLGPYFYYAFIRGVSFYENGLIYNKGLPFFNLRVPYQRIRKYKLLHPQHLLTLTLDNDEILIVGDNDIDRVISLLDRQGIPGDLAQNEFIKILRHVKIYFYVVVVFLLSLYLAKKLGIFKYY